jgi:hypothetical protein
MRSPSVVRDSQFANAIYLFTKIASISEVKNLLRVPVEQFIFLHVEKAAN